ncbi:MAG: hypothetical protein ACXAB5_01395, partial [Candidatus Thorarchaeota archaeon]
EIPITMGQRIMWSLLSIIGLIMSGVGGELLVMGMAMESDEMLYIIGGIASVILGIILTFAGFRVLIMTQRTKKG